MEASDLLIIAAIAIVALSGLAAGGWAAWRAERRVSRIAENWAMYGGPREPEPARVKEPESAEERALVEARDTALERLTENIMREKPNVGREKAEKEAEKLLSHFGGGQ